MLTPADKLHSGGNNIIQIVITRSCDLFNCSNCTQLLPFRTDTLHMSPRVFYYALESLAEWPGVIGIFGGNPCSHPQFSALMEIYERAVPEQSRRGLWSNNLLGHGDLVRRVFYPNGYFNLNAHADPAAAANIDRFLPGKLIPSSRNTPAMHAAILADYRDIGMSNEMWAQLRETCDINRKWSAAIVERNNAPYAYFCEVASSLDGIRGENNGIPATLNWWKLGMQAHESQVRNCCDQGCGVPLRLKGHYDKDEKYDVTPSWEARLTVQRGPVGLERVEATTDNLCADASDYMRRWTE